jgi:anti-sigma factor RsiW
MTDPTLERLLGPRDPELGCDECFDLLDEYVEDRLPGAQGKAMHAHLEGCPACREEYESLRALVDSDV